MTSSAKSRASWQANRRMKISWHSALPYRKLTVTATSSSRSFKTSCKIHFKEIRCYTHKFSHARNGYIAHIQRKQWEWVCELSLSRFWKNSVSTSCLGLHFFCRECRRQAGRCGKDLKEEKAQHESEPCLGTSTADAAEQETKENQRIPQILGAQKPELPLVPKSQGWEVTQRRPSLMKVLCDSLPFPSKILFSFSMGWNLLLYFT